MIYLFLASSITHKNTDGNIETWNKCTILQVVWKEASKQ